MKTFENNTCPAGHYCPVQSMEPSPCPVGTFSSQTGNVFLSDCIPCTSGYYCNSPGAVEVTGPCRAGYYCSSRATTELQPSESATGGPCPVGSYCPSGSGAPLACPR